MDPLLQTGRVAARPITLLLQDVHATLLAAMLQGRPKKGPILVCCWWAHHVKGAPNPFFQGVHCTLTAGEADVVYLAAGGLRLARAYMNA